LARIAKVHARLALRAHFYLSLFYLSRLCLLVWSLVCQNRRKIKKIKEKGFVMAYVLAKKMGSKKTGTKIVLGILALGAQLPAHGMQLLTALRAGAKTRAYSPLGLRGLVLRNSGLRTPVPSCAVSKFTHAPCGSRLLSSSRESESWLAGQEELLKKAEAQTQELLKIITVLQGHVGERLHGEKPEPEIEKLKNREMRAQLALGAMHKWEKDAEQWVRICTQAIIDFEHKQGDKPISELEQQALACAHKDEREAGVNLRRAKEGVEQAKLELREIQELQSATRAD
jgi:hypothetical protein